jgi:hypothetical protein
MSETYIEFPDILVREFYRILGNRFPTLIPGNPDYGSFTEDQIETLIGEYWDLVPKTIVDYEYPEPETPNTEPEEIPIEAIIPTSEFKRIFHRGIAALLNIRISTKLYFTQDYDQVQRINQDLKITKEATENPEIDISAIENRDLSRIHYGDFQTIIGLMTISNLGSYIRITLEQLNNVFQSGTVSRFEPGSQKYQQLTQKPNIVFLTYVVNNPKPYLTIARYDQSNNQLLPPV